MKFDGFSRRFVNLWPPFLFSGIQITHIADDHRLVKVKLKLRFWNTNYIGTQFGGSIYSMTDPFYMIMLIKNLGDNYRVIDKAATIRYLKLGKGDLFADFYITEEDISEIKSRLSQEDKIEWSKQVDVKNKEGDLIAEVVKTLSIKKKKS